MTYKSKTISKKVVIAWIQAEEEEIARLRTRAIELYGSIDKIPQNILPSLRIGAGYILKKIRGKIEND
jgi:hypothetical protein